MAFSQLNPAGQLKVFKAIRKQLPKLTGDATQALVRSEYSPRRFPDLYADPKKAIQKLQVKKRGRKRKPLTRDEKRVLNNSLELAVIELEDLQRDNVRMKRECIIAGPVANAIMRNKTLREMLSSDMREELERFVEVY